LLSLMIPHMLNAESAGLESRIDAELDGQSPGLKFVLACKLAGPFGKDVMKPTFKSFSLFTLPLGVIARTHEQYVLARHVSRAAGRREHLTLHRRFNLARDRDKKIVPLRTR